VNSRRAPALSFAPLVVLALVLGLMAPTLAAIHPGDSLYITVWNHPELSKSVVVDASGGVRVPLSGLVMVGGLSETDAGKKLADALRSSIAYPAVSVETVTQGKSIFISGGPGGVLTYEPGESLSAALAVVMNAPGAAAASQSLNAAGENLTRLDDSSSEIRSEIDLHRVKVQRDNALLGEYDTVAFGVTGETGPVLQPGDTIIFSYKPVPVRVLGAVGHPGVTYLGTDQPISEAVTQAGGLLPTSSSNHILLQRDGQARSLALGDPAFSAPAQPGDVITVPVAPRVNVVGTVVTPGVVSLKTDSTLLSAMYTAGGPTKQANLKDVQVIHGNTKTSYDVTALTHGDMSQNPVLADGDTVVVPQGHYVDWTGFFGILGGVAAGLASRVPL
jgi:polysaccharide export outer membrane protein